MAEDAGAVNLADAVLLAYLSSHAEVSEVEQGRIEAVRARLAWKTGNHEGASERYERVLRLARFLGSDELRVRGLIGMAVLARLAGNYPRSRDIAQEALTVAANSGMSRLAATCHHMLMVCAAVAERFPDAVVHGWQAYVAATNDPMLESEILGNLGQLFLDLGEASTAVAAFTAVLERHPVDRILVHALGGCALASARTGHAEGVFLSASRLEEIGDRARPYEAAVAYAELARAYQVIGQSRLGADYREKALAIASAHGYNEIPFRLEQPEEISSSPKAAWNPSMETVAGAVRQLVGA
jgi:tetratricopeptide (TPR) repeat protein